MSMVVSFNLSRILMNMQPIGRGFTRIAEVRSRKNKRKRTPNLKSPLSFMQFLSRY